MNFTMSAKKAIPVSSTQTQNSELDKNRKAEDGNQNTEFRIGKDFVGEESGMRFFFL